MKKVFYIFLVLVFFLNIFFSLFYNLSVLEIVKNINKTEYQIFTQIRLPRTIATYFVGAALAVVGCVLQSLFLNPLCEGYTLGISSCAGIGVVVGMIFNLPLNKFFSSFLGVILSMLVVFFLVFYFKKTIDISFVLAGIVLNSLFSGIIILLTFFFDPYKLHYVLLWLLGSFSSLEPNYVYISCVIFLCCFIFFIAYSYKLDIIVLGKDKSTSLGVNEQSVKNLLIFVCILVLSLCVSLVGIVSFVGIIIPNIVKALTGLIHKRWFIWSMISGGIFVSICDNLARNLLYPTEIPISVFTGIIGSIFFVIYVIKRTHIWKY